jgi:type II secretory pathway pseudopilin PulG
MFNKKLKAFTLLEVVVAMFVLGMISLVFLNNSTNFLSSQQKLVNIDRKDQLADLIIQDIMEYIKKENAPYGSVEAGATTWDGSTDIINVTGLDNNNLPQPGDIFLVNDVRGRYTVESITGPAAGPWTINTEEDFPDTSIGNNTVVSFIAVNKDQLNCFNGLNLNNAAPANLAGCGSLPTEVTNLHNHWRTQINNELGSVVNVRTIEVTSEGLVKVTLGDGTNNTVLAKKVNTCIFDDAADTVAFTFPGLDDPITTGIMSGTQDPVTHYNNAGDARRYPNLANDSGALVNLNPTCNDVGASTCRQSYAWSDAIAVFLYRYTGGTTLRVRPSKCNNGIWDGQCDGVVLEPNGLSLWFIFDEYNNANDTADQNTFGYQIAGSNEGGFIQFEIRNLPSGARIVVFDDGSESCTSGIASGQCNGNFKWNDAHDGMVIDLDTSNLNSLDDLELEIENVPFGVDRWRVLNPTPAECLIASDGAGSDHGSEFTQENENDCWTTVIAQFTTLQNNITSQSGITIQLADSSMFPASGNLQIGSEYVSYNNNNTATNEITLTSRGSRGSANISTSISSGDTPKFSRQLSGEAGDPQIAAFGGYAEINGEVFRVDYGDGLTPSLNGYQSSIMQFEERTNLGSGPADHAAGSTVRNYDMRAQAWGAGTRVWEGPANSIPVVQARNGNTYPRTRIKRRVTLNLSSVSVCQ